MLILTGSAAGGGPDAWAERRTGRFRWTEALATCGRLTGATRKTQQGQKTAWAGRWASSPSWSASSPAMKFTGSSSTQILRWRPSLDSATDQRPKRPPKPPAKHRHGPPHISPSSPRLVTSASAVRPLCRCHHCATVPSASPANPDTLLVVVSPPLHKFRVVVGLPVHAAAPILGWSLLPIAKEKKIP